MSRPTPDAASFNRRIDDLVENILRENLISKEFRARYVKAAGLLRRVAKYDPELAFQLLSEVMMLMYCYSLGMVREILPMSGHPKDSEIR